MSNIVQFRLRSRPTREQAKQWLSVNIDGFPENLPGDIGPVLFHGWRFIRSNNGIVYFANCLEPGINEMEFSATLAN